MKKSIFLFVILAFALNAYAYDFMVANEDGAELCYQIIGTDRTEVRLTHERGSNSGWDSTSVNYPNLRVEVLRIPETVVYDNKSYVVTAIDYSTFSCVKTLKKVILPKTVKSIFPFAFNYYSGIEEIVVDEENSVYTAKDGILYSKDMKRLCCYPPCKKDSIYIIPEGPQTVEMCAFLLLRNLRDITFPLSLKEMENLAMVDTVIRRAVFQDSVRILDYGSVSLMADEIVLGNQVGHLISHL